MDSLGPELKKAAEAFDGSKLLYHLKNGYDVNYPITSTGRTIMHVLMGVKPEMYANVPGQ